MPNIIFMRPIKKRKAILAYLLSMYKEFKGAKLSLDFYHGYCSGYLEALNDNMLISEKQRNVLQRMIKKEDEKKRR